MTSLKYQIKVKVILRRLFLIILVFCFLAYLSYYSANIYSDIEEPYPFPTLPGFGTAPKYQNKVHNATVYFKEDALLKDSLKLTAIFEEIPKNAWNQVLKHEFIGKNPETKEWLQEHYQIGRYDYAFYVMDSCFLRLNQIKCIKKDTVILFK